MTRFSPKRTKPEHLLLMLNPGKVGSPWSADPGRLIGMGVDALGKSIRLRKMHPVFVPFFFFLFLIEALLGALPTAFRSCEAVSP